MCELKKKTEHEQQNRWKNRKISLLFSFISILLHSIQWKFFHFCFFGFFFVSIYFDFFVFFWLLFSFWCCFSIVYFVEMKFISFIRHHLTHIQLKKMPPLIKAWNRYRKNKNIWKKKLQNVLFFFLANKNEEDEEIEDQL